MNKFPTRDNYGRWLDSWMNPYNGCTIDHDSEIRTYMNGELHSYDDQPAFKSNRKHEWWANGVLHKTNGPAAIYLNACDGTIKATVYCLNGQLHREDGPSYEDATHEEWSQYGTYHRLFYPAFIKKGHRYRWFHHGDDITDEVLRWAKEFDVDLDNLTEDDKAIYLIKFGN